MTKKALI